MDAPRPGQVKRRRDLPAACWSAVVGARVSGAGGDDRGEVGGGEAQVFADEGARHSTCGRFLAQPGSLDLQQFSGLFGLTSNTRKVEDYAPQTHE